MQLSLLSRYFQGVATKRLSAVEVFPAKSNQHEFNGVESMRQILGSEPRKYPAQFIYLGKQEEDTLTSTDFVTWYDARKRHPTRSEYRLYFPTTRVSEKAAEGDLLVIGTRTDGSVIVIIAKSSSTFERQLQWLFRLPEKPTSTFSVNEIDKDKDTQLGFAQLSVLEDIGIEVQETDETHLEEMLLKFGGNFPTTKEFSLFARTTYHGDISSSDPDIMLAEWMDHEEILFRTLEHNMVAERIQAGFNDVDSFISFSLSVHNRRKSRAGYALENHLEQILKDHNIAYSRDQETENKAKPDFIFPGIECYRDKDFPLGRLTMLGAKSTCKDRWRQVLSEAARISDKHLLTLEPGISENQTNEMQANKLQLVIPSSIHDSYSTKQQAYIMNVVSFLDLIEERQGNYKM